MSQTTYLRLEPSEASVLQAAATIYAAYLSTGAVDAYGEEQMVTKAVDKALALARRVDDLVASDDELSDAGSASGFPKLQAPQVFRPSQG